jgi:hypothetical protein
LQQSTFFIAITALWAFVEAGLGGFLHALHLPFTGIVLGGFAILMISLLAQYATNPFTQIIQATLIVLAIKVMVHPATSPMAYIAVGFQGLLGALIFSFSTHHLITYLLFATISMVESGGQKLLVMTIFGGKTFWQGVDGLGKQINGIFHFNHIAINSHTLIIIYLSVFLMWGIILAFWMNALPHQIKKRKNNYLHLVAKNNSEPISKKKNNYMQIIIVLLIIILAIYSCFATNQSSFINGLFYIARTTAIIISWQILLLPIWRKIIARWSNKQTKSEFYIAVQNKMPQIANMVSPLYDDVNRKYSGLLKWKEFFLGLIVITIYPNDAK